MIIRLVTLKFKQIGRFYFKKSTKCNAERKTEAVVDESLCNVHVRAFNFNFCNSHCNLS